MQADEELIKLVAQCIEAICDDLENPWDFSPNGDSNVFNRYRDDHGLTNVSKLLRNVAFVQRLHKLKDELVDAILSLQVLRGNITLSADRPDLPSSTLKAVQTEHLSVLTMRAVACLFNGLAYFYDFPVKDDSYDTEETINYTYLRDPRLAVKIATLQKQEALLLTERVVAEQAKGYFNLATIIPNEMGAFTMEAAKNPGVDGLTAASEKVLVMVYQILLEFKDEEVHKKYAPTLGYTSPDDLIVKTDPSTSFWKKPENLPKDEPNLFKIYNFWTDSSTRIETSTYSISRNYSYKDSLLRVHRSADQQTSTYIFASGAPMKAQVDTKKAQEGEYIWSHTLEFKQPIKRSGYRAKRLEDACLLLTWIIGSGVYSDESSRLYSHKAKGVVSFPKLEYGNILKIATGTLNGAHKSDAGFYRLILTKYRQAIQPATVEGLLIRIWEILDLIADYYCTSEKKDLPKGYKDHDAVAEAIREAFKELEKKLKVPLTGDTAYTPILIQRSIGQKVRDVLAKFEIAKSIGVDEKELKKAVGKVYGIRSKLTHSSSTRKGASASNEAMNTYFFISELVFALMTGILTRSDDSIPASVKASLSGFVADNNFYLARSKKYKNQGKQLDEMMKVLAGEKPWPKGKKIISI